MARKPNLSQLLADVTLDAPEAEAEGTEGALTLVRPDPEEPTAPAGSSTTTAGSDRSDDQGADVDSQGQNEAGPAEDDSAVQEQGRRRRRRRPADVAPDRSLDESQPRYTQLEQKHALLWPDQIESLATVARRISRSTRGVEGRERITENTLIRVAVDLILSHAQEGRLQGATEDELRTSVLG